MRRLLLQNIGLLQKATEVVEPSGQRTPTWATVATVPCMVNPAPVAVAMSLGVEEAITHVVYTEYRADIVADPLDRWRIIVDGVVYEIVEPYDPAGRHHHLELRCRRMQGP